MHRIITFIIAILALSGCQNKSLEPERYVELREGTSGRQQILIRSDVWKGVFTIHGYGGHAHNVHAWCTLEGEASTFDSPRFHQNSNTQFEYSGTITIDRKAETVKIDLLRIKGPDGAMSQSCPENGVYRIKRVTRDEFITPE